MMLMYLPQKAQAQLWDWVKDKHTSTIAAATGRSCQHVRNVLKGRTEDEAVLIAAVDLRARTIKNAKKTTTYLLRKLSF
jgi:predicted transcriptional regulator